MNAKLISIQEFRMKGFLQEANRQFFHPLGLALQVNIDDDGNESLGGIWDYRDDPEGILFAEGSIDVQKAMFVKGFQDTKAEIRKEKLGFVIQPLPSLGVIMEPICFPQANKTLAKPQGMTDEECGPLPIFNDGQQSISLWKMTWRERLSALFYGRVWLYVVFGPSQPPVALEAKKDIFVIPAKRRVKVFWTCSNNAHHEHKTKFGALLCGRWQALRLRYAPLSAKNKE